MYADIKLIFGIYIRNDDLQINKSSFNMNIQFKKLTELRPFQYTIKYDSFSALFSAMDADIELIFMPPPQKSGCI